MIDRLKSLTRQQKQMAVGIVVVLLAAAAGVVFVLTRGDGDDLPDDVALKVGGQEVTISELNTRIDQLESLYGAEVPEDKKGRDEFNRSTAKSMAMDIVLSDVAKAEGIKVSDKDVDKLLDEGISQNFDGDRNAFLDSLANQGASEKWIREEGRRWLVRQAILDKLAPDVSVTDEELKENFAKYKDKLGQPERRAVSNIVVATRGQANQVAKRLRQGESVASVARAVSIDESTRSKGGKLGAVAQAEFEPAVGKAVFATGAGQVYGPVKGSYGWNVGVVGKIDKARAGNLKRDGELLRQVLELKKSTDAWKVWLEKKMRAAHVVYAEAYQPKDPYDVSSIVNGDQNQTGAP